MARSLCAVLAAASLTAAAGAVINVPGANGSDNAFTPAASITVDLSQAAAGAWDSASPMAGKGVYDASKWAVVYHYSSVNVPAGATIRFANHPSRAPVVWLVSGDVTISGSLNLNGSSVAYDEAGPGGFRSGTVSGLGPGGAINTTTSSASYGTTGTFGASPGRTYGNSQATPLIGGSAYAGYTGGGAILIAATGTVRVNGSIIAQGGTRSTGGAIRLVADQIAGTGSLNVAGGIQGGSGRLRLETATTVDPTLTYTPASPSTGRPSDPALVFPASNAPSARIVSVGNETVPADPRANFGSASDALPDIVNTSLPVVIETKNVPITATVNLRMAPLAGTATLVQATFTSGDVNTARWAASYTPAEGTTALQVRVETTP